MTGSDVSHVTESDLSHCPEVSSAHAQPEVAPYPPQWGLLIGSDVSHVIGRGPVRKQVLRMPGFFPRFFLSSNNMATGCDLRSLDTFGVPLGMRNRKLCNTRSSSKQCWLGCSLRRPRPITIVNPASNIQHGYRNQPPTSYIQHGDWNQPWLSAPFIFIQCLYRSCSTSKSAFENFHLQNVFFLIFLHF